LPKILFLKNYVAGTWLEFIKTLEGANVEDDNVDLTSLAVDTADAGALVQNPSDSLESSASVEDEVFYIS
jgi:hypothetical protein